LTDGGNVVARGVASIAPTAPGLCSADVSGHGYAEALVLRVRPDGSQGILPGLDQVKLRLQTAHRGLGDVPVELLVDGRAANLVRIKLT
jgi:hypothetical protein